MKTGDIVRLHPLAKIARGLISVPEGHPPWSDNWDVLTTLATWEVGLVIQVMNNPRGHQCIKLFTSHGSGWIEGCELTNL
jgi:hypothetical protein